MTNSSKLVVYVDVDDTLVRSVGAKRIPIPAVVQHVRDLHDAGAVLYCWSTGGADYARDTAIELRLHDCFAGFLPKPNVLLDDQAAGEWRRCVHVRPLDVAPSNVAEYKARFGR